MFTASPCDTTRGAFMKPTTALPIPGDEIRAAVASAVAAYVVGGEVEIQVARVGVASVDQG
jgi:hypothetical protein